MKVNKAELQEALGMVKPGLARKEMIDQTDSFAFLGNRVVTYNDEISISHPVEGLGVRGVIKAQALYEFLSKVKKDEIDIECEENQVIIKAGRAKAGLVFEQDVKLPVEEIGDVSEWKPLPEKFVDALKFCYPCCAKDMCRPILSCVHVCEDQVEASDSYQIARHELDEEIPVGEFLIPAIAVKELIRYKIKEIALGNSWVHFRTEAGTVFSSRILNDKFPNTKNHLEVDGVIFHFPKNTDQILDRASVFCKKNTCAGENPMVNVEITEEKMKVSARNEYGWFEEDAQVKHKGKPIQFVVCIDFLISLFDKLQNCIIGENRIGFSGPDWQHVLAIRASGSDS